jgi:hypothetical protein
MARTIASVVVGYLVMFAVVFGIFSMAYLAMGTDRAFKPGTYDVSATWLVTSFVLGFVAAVIAGLVCAALARSANGPRALAAVVVVLGVLMAIPTLSAPPGPATRDAAVANLEAMRNARTPAWVAFLNPVIGAAGVLLGGSRRGKPRL